MKYNDLINSCGSNASEETRDFYIEKYNFVPLYYFIHFKRNMLSLTQRKALHNAWKARISIHPDDLEKAWDIIYPTLIRSADSFKVVDMNRLSYAKICHNKKRDEWVCAKTDFYHEDIVLLRDAGFKLFYWLNASQNNTLFKQVMMTSWRLITHLFLYLAPKFCISSYVASQYDELMHQFNTRSKHLQRFTDGMSITIYMLPGRESLNFKMLKTLEHLLLLNKIKPGVIYPTDRVLGKYISVRHPGLKVYHDAVLVSSYNPDKVPDPFPSIQFSRALKLKPNQIQQSASYNSFFNQNQASSLEKNYSVTAFSI